MQIGIFECTGIMGKDLIHPYIQSTTVLCDIEKAYGLKVAQRHADDATSVNMWVTEMMSQEDNPIILYKQQGEPQPPECNYLCKEDFVYTGTSNSTTSEYDEEAC